MNLFAPVTAERRRCRLPASATPVRAVLKAGGFAESVVVTARRVETRLAETPQKIEVIDATDIERSVAADLTDVLKKNAGVDVVQYTRRALRRRHSRIPAADFRHQQAVVAAHRRPAVRRHESGDAAAGQRRADRSAQGRGVGGVRVVGHGRRDQRDHAPVARQDRRPGADRRRQLRHDRACGTRRRQRVVERRFRRHRERLRSARRHPHGQRQSPPGDQLQDLRRKRAPWRHHAPAAGASTAAPTLYRGRDISTPPDIAAGTIGQGSKDIERGSGDARVTGRAGAHDLSFTGYRAAEGSHSSNVTTSNPLDLPYLPYLSFESELDWIGAQARDSWNWSRLNSVVLGADYEKVTSVSRSYTRTGDPDGAVLGGQQQAHGRLLRREHAEAERRPHGRGHRRARSTASRPRRSTRLSRPISLRPRARSPSSIPASGSSTSSSRACAGTSRSDVRSFRPRR